MVVIGVFGVRLIDWCVVLEELLERGVMEGLELDVEYYIGKNLILLLERIFNLVGVNVRVWYEEVLKV